ncbi:hypothetical protein LCGC14_2628950, partial [marine sediment metagenome]
AKLFKQPIGRFNKDRIMSEKQKLIEFEHKNIVKFFDKGFFKYENQEYFFFILEYIDGKNLEEIDKKIFNQPFITRIKLLKSILKAEQEFLGNFQAHNDLTLKNIMITTKIPGGGHITTDGLDEKKIKEGFDFEIIANKIKIGKMYSIPSNRYQFKKEIEKINSTNPVQANIELKDILIKILDLLPE